MSSTPRDLVQDVLHTYSRLLKAIHEAICAAQASYGSGRLEAMPLRNRMFGTPTQEEVDRSVFHEIEDAKRCGYALAVWSEEQDDYFALSESPRRIFMTREEAMQHAATVLVGLAAELAVDEIMGRDLERTADGIPIGFKGGAIKEAIHIGERDLRRDWVRMAIQKMRGGR